MLDVEEVLKRLPAEVRAQVAWTQKPIEEGLLRLRSEPLTDGLVAEVLEPLIRPFLTIGRVTWKWLAKNRDDFLALVMQDFRSREERLTAFLDTEDAIDTLRWVVGRLRSFYVLSFSLPVPEQLPQVGDEAWTDTVLGPEFKAIMTGLVCFMAASDEAKTGSDRERAHDLLDVAFLQLTKLGEVTHDLGLWVSAFPSETLEERRARLLRDADRLREVLVDEDWALLEQARMHDLR